MTLTALRLAPIVFALGAACSPSWAIGGTMTSAEPLWHVYASSERRMDKSSAAEAARAAHGGKVLRVEEINNGGRVMYRVKLLLEGGRVKIVTIDASSGRAS